MMKKTTLLLTSALTFGSHLLAIPLSATAQQGAEGAANNYNEIVTVEQATGSPTLALGGTVAPYREVTLAAQLPGRVKYLAGIEGDNFKAGDLLVAIDDTELLAKRSAAMAQHSNAQSQVNNAGVQYSRELWSPRSRNAPGGMGMPNLFDQMFTGKAEEFFDKRDRDADRAADLYASGSQIEQAKSALLQASAEIRAIDAKLRDARSLAPFGGVIVKKLVEEGDTVQPGQPLLNFADLTYLQVVVDVPARLSTGLKRGMMLQAELDVDGKVVPVRIAQIYPMADAERHTLKVKFDLPVNTSAPGMYVKVRVPNAMIASGADRPVIPKSSIRYNGSLPGVYVMDQRNLPQLRLIRVGEDVGDGKTTILSGLRVGERILKNPNGAVSSGWASTPNHTAN